MDASLSTQLLAWFNTITIPALLLAAWKISRWIAKEEQEARTSFTGLASSIENLKSNHLHHIQESLDGIKQGQDKMAEQMVENTREIVQAINGSKDALVSAFLAAKAISKAN